MKIKSTLIISCALSALALPGMAQHLVPYTSSIGSETTKNIDKEWTVINANEDGRKWQYSDRDNFSRWTEYNVGVLYERSLETPIAADDWIISPQIHLEKGKMYKVTWLAMTDGFNEKYEVVMSEGATLNDVTGTSATQLFEIDKFMCYDKFEKKSVNITADKTTDYNFGFHVTSSANGYRLFLTGFSIEDYKLTPAVVKDLQAEVEGDKMAVSLSWSLPTTDDTDTALDLSKLTAVKVYRDGTLITTLPGTATSYTDESITESGFYEYSVAAVAEAEGEAASVTTDFVGVLSALSLPFESDFSNPDAVSFLWTYIDANNDELTWKHWADHGTYFIYYPNQRYDTVEDDWILSPMLHFPDAGKYPMVWSGYGYHGNLELWLLKGTSLEDRESRLGVITRDDLTTFSPKDYNFEINITTPGDYCVGIHCNNNPTTGIEYYMYGLKVDKGSGISSVMEDVDMENAVIYDLLGNRVYNPLPGSIYIVNGKKLILK